MAILAKHPAGMEKKDLLNALRFELPDANLGSVSAQINLMALDGRLVRPEWGIYLRAEDYNGPPIKSAVRRKRSEPEEVPKAPLIRDSYLYYHSEFEEVVAKSLGRLFGVEFGPSSDQAHPREFAFASSDGRLLGDIIYGTMVAGRGLSKAKYSEISETVWLLEKSPAETRFVVFGHQIQVPEFWLQKYGHVPSDVWIFFCDHLGILTRLR